MFGVCFESEARAYCLRKYHSHLCSLRSAVCGVSANYGFGTSGRRVQDRCRPVSVRTPVEEMHGSLCGCIEPLGAERVSKRRQGQRGMCSRARLPHKPLSGTHPTFHVTGTRVAEPYPTQLCAGLAHCLLPNKLSHTLLKLSNSGGHYAMIWAL